MKIGLGRVQTRECWTGKSVARTLLTFFALLIKYAYRMTNCIRVEVIDLPVSKSETFVVV